MEGNIRYRACKLVRSNPSIALGVKPARQKFTRSVRLGVRETVFFDGIIRTQNKFRVLRSRQNYLVILGVNNRPDDKTLSTNNFVVVGKEGKERDESLHKRKRTETGR